MLTVVLVSALLAIVVALAQYGARHDFLLALARTSGYLLWNGLLCAPPTGSDAPGKATSA